MNYEYCNGFTHTIKKGDTLYEISRKHNVPLALLLRANPYVDVFNLRVGDTICIPSEENQMVPYPINSMPRPKNWDNNRDNDDRDNRNRDEDRYDDRDNRDWDNDRQNRERNDIENMTNTEPPAEMVWVKYVVKPGDTLEDILGQMEGSLEDFVKKNGSSSIYMLPGIAYYIQKEK